MSVAGGRITASAGSNLIGVHAQDRNQEATCYVGNIDPQANEEIIWELCVQAGPVGEYRLLGLRGGMSCAPLVAAEEHRASQGLGAAFLHRLRTLLTLMQGHRVAGATTRQLGLRRAPSTACAPAPACSGAPALSVLRCALCPRRARLPLLQ